MKKTQQTMRWAVLLSGSLCLSWAGSGCSEPDRDLQSIGSAQARHSPAQAEKKPQRSVRGEWWRSPNQHAQVPPSQTGGGSAAGATDDRTNPNDGTGGQNASGAGTNSTGQTGSGQDQSGTGSGAQSAEKTGADGQGAGQAAGSGQTTGTENGTGQAGAGANQGPAQGQPAGSAESGRGEAHSGNNVPSKAEQPSPAKKATPAGGKPESGKTPFPARSQVGEKPDTKAAKSATPESHSPNNPGPRAGRQAGNLTGQDRHKMDSPERSMFPKRASGDRPDQGPRETVERDSFEFTTPTTQQAERMVGASSRYERNGAGDLSVMKVPPAKRQLIRNYFRNLRSVSASQPASAPAFSQSQPEG